ncbi:ABC transporter ATP-binding protein [Tissierella praeacuta]|uniref:ABC transporter ATP-binding protein n=1 Tax=Tissierella praeacuta TaxID=43131 RepID=UPI0028A9DD7B|nr:ABC transporter ATP-binding protein [Tissierella praeacuta]
MNEYIVEMTDISKHFGDVRAVIDGQFNLKKGEIHSLIGENGAGKSTMMKMLYGIYGNDSGSIKINGKEFTGLTPAKAIANGVGMVHQEFMLVKELTVLENIILGFEPRKNITIDFDKARKDIQEYIDIYNMDIQPNKRINQISLGEAQRVEIIKTLYRGAEIVILDEPTAVLTPQECVKFFEILRNMKADGKSIVFISHKLNEVMEISDRVTVMRNGKFVSSVEKKDTNTAELAKMMVGREVFLKVEKKKSNIGDVVLKVDDIWTSGEKELSKIRGISMDVKAGEIVGIAGIDGNGQSELIEAIAGLRKVEKGIVNLDGKNITNLTPLKIRKLGLAHVPEDRNLRGLNRGLSIMDNMVAAKIDKRPFVRGIALNKKAIASFSKDLIERFDVRPTDPNILTQALSGGNAQKIVVAREVDADGKLLIASQPTRGVDIGAIESIRKILNEEKAKGKAILLVSADLEEILSLSDRIVVMYEGKITGILNAEDANEDNIGLLMMGGVAKDKDSAEMGGGH